MSTIWGTVHGYIIVGYTGSFGNGYYDVYLIKTNSYGDTIWTKTFGEERDDKAFCVKQTNDGGFVIAGSLYSIFDGDLNIYLIKTNQDGDITWTKTYSGSSDDIGWSVIQTYDSGYIISGYTYSFGAGNTDVFLVRANSNGDTLWTRCYGGAGYDYGYSIELTSDTCYVIVGYTNSFSLGESDIQLIKINDRGDALWTRTYDGGGHDLGYSVDQTRDGGYIIAGYTDSFSDFSDVYLIKTNTLGEPEWSKAFNRYGIDFGWAVQQTDDDGYIITGTTQSIVFDSSDVYLIKTDNNGVVNVESAPEYLPDNFLYQNYPNPFNPITTIEYFIPKRSMVILNVFDIMGRLISTLVNEEKPAEFIRFNGKLKIFRVECTFIGWKLGNSVKPRNLF